MRLYREAKVRFDEDAGFKAHEVRHLVPLAPPPSPSPSPMCSMSIPNCVPQSPTWFSRSTEAPENSRHRHSASPITVLRRCPTCISLVTFGLEKSTTARPQGGLGAHDGGSRAPGSSPPR